MLSSIVDGTVVVVRVGRTARDAVRRGVAQLRVVNGRVLGAVLNDVDFGSGVYYGGYGYNYCQPWWNGWQWVYPGYACGGYGYGM